MVITLTIAGRPCGLTSTLMLPLLRVSLGWGSVIFMPSALRMKELVGLKIGIPE